MVVAMASSGNNSNNGSSILYYYYTDVASVIEEHFAKALSPPHSSTSRYEKSKDASSIPMSQRNLPASFWKPDINHPNHNHTNVRSGHEISSQTSHELLSAMHQAHLPLSHLTHSQQHQQPLHPASHSSHASPVNHVNESSSNSSLVSTVSDANSPSSSSLTPSFFLPAAHDPYAYHHHAHQVSAAAAAAAASRTTYPQTGSAADPHAWYAPYASSLASSSPSHHHHHHPYASHVYHRSGQPSLVHDLSSYSTAASNQLNAQYSSLLLRTAAAAGSPSRTGSRLTAASAAANVFDKTSQNDTMSSWLGSAATRCHHEAAINFAGHHHHHHAMDPSAGYTTTAAAYEAAMTAAAAISSMETH